MSQLKGCGIIAISEFLDYKEEIFISAGTILIMFQDNRIDADAYHEIEKDVFLVKPCLVLKDEHWQYKQTYEATGQETCIVSTEPVLLATKIEDPKFLFSLKGAKGGGSAPAPAYQPAPQPTAGQSAKEWADAMPQVFETQMKYAPLQAQSELDLAQQYAAPIGQAYKSAMEQLYPETAGLQENLAGQAATGMKAEMPDWMKDSYKDQFNSNLGTNAGSPIGADYMSRGMIQQQQGYNDYYRNLALSISGRQPLAQPTAPQTGNYSQNFTPDKAMAMNANTYGSYTSAAANMYGSQLGYQSNVRSQNMALWGEAIGAGGMMAGAAMSSIDYKHSVETFDEDALEVIKKLDVKEWKYMWDEDVKRRVGIILEEAPDQFSESNKKEMDVLTMLGYLTKAVQQLAAKMEKQNG